MNSNHPLIPEGGLFKYDAIGGQAWMFPDMTVCGLLEDIPNERLLIAAYHRCLWLDFEPDDANAHSMNVLTAEAWRKWGKNEKPS